ncbi:MAG: TetR/AcrR family transcriptional regulator C-terminal domain-containing protein [Clostridium sp.]|nr:TetR/AcrR family transcriptional regulator C-terminal domain-containing protein [Clostridium sp.]
MNPNKTDRRVKYTKMVIRNSFIKLLKQKPISKITIKEICENADVNRATFYAHYQNQYDLLNKIEARLIDDINAYLSNYEFKDNMDIASKMLEKILDYVKENSDIFDILLISNGDMTFQNEFIKIITKQHFSPDTRSGSLSKEDAAYIFSFSSSGSIGVIQKWLKDDMKKPTNKLAELILKIAASGSAAFDY